MASTRKPSAPSSKLRVQLNGELCATIEDKTRLAALKRYARERQLCVDLSVQCGSTTFGLSAIYPDSLPKGGFKALFTGKQLAVRVSGVLAMDAADFGDDKSFRKILAGGSIVLGSMSDADCEPIELEGGSLSAPVGVIPAADAEPQRPTKAKTAKAKTPKTATSKMRKKSNRTPLEHALEIVLTPEDGIARAAKDLVGKQDSMDYVLERQLETVTEALLKDIDGVKEILSSRSASMKDLGAALRTVWLESEIPECGYELKVRAAEALGAWGVATEEPRATITKRLASKRFEHRMWAAQAVRAAGWKDAARLLKPLASDSFSDDNGIYLVREAAGFFD